MDSQRKSGDVTPGEIYSITLQLIAGGRCNYRLVQEALGVPGIVEKLNRFGNPQRRAYLAAKNGEPLPD